MAWQLLLSFMWIVPAPVSGSQFSIPVKTPQLQVENPRRPFTRRDMEGDVAAKRLPVRGEGKRRSVVFAGEVRQAYPSQP
jgi:hypothetical protein